MKELLLSNGGVAILDDEDFDVLSRWRWKRQPQGYASRTVTGGGVVLMHRVITNAPSGMHVDHVNRNKLDNRRCNLRVVSRSQNMHNRPRQRNSSSGIKGVCFDVSRGKWKASIQVNRKQVNLGRFDSIERAAEAYAEASRRLVGEFAFNGDQA